MNAQAKYANSANPGEQRGHFVAPPNRIKELRKLPRPGFPKGYSQAQLAERIQPPTDASTISRKEKLPNIEAYWAIRIARALECEPADLYATTATPSANTPTATPSQLLEDLGAIGGPLAQSRPPIAWLTARLDIAAEDISLVEAPDDAFAPGIGVGDPLLVSTAALHLFPAPAGLFLVRAMAGNHGAPLTLRSITPVLGQASPLVRVTADNQKYEPVTLPPTQISIAGRVVYHLRRT